MSKGGLDSLGSNFKALSPELVPESTRSGRDDFISDLQITKEWKPPGFAFVEFIQQCIDGLVVLLRIGIHPGEDQLVFFATKHRIGAHHELWPQGADGLFAAIGVLRFPIIATEHFIQTASKGDNEVMDVDAMRVYTWGVVKEVVCHEVLDPVLDDPP